MYFPTDRISDSARTLSIFSCLPCLVTRSHVLPVPLEKIVNATWQQARSPAPLQLRFCQASPSQPASSAGALPEFGPWEKKVYRVAIDPRRLRARRASYADDYNVLFRLAARKGASLGCSRPSPLAAQNIKMLFFAAPSSATSRSITAPFFSSVLSNFSIVQVIHLLRNSPFHRRIGSTDKRSHPYPTTT
jgi:hypothetical protein